jgi:protein SCO1/2
MRLWLLRGVYGLAALAVVGTLAFAVLQPVKVLPRISLAPGLALTDQEARRLTSEDLRGQIVLYTFSYTRCGAPCSEMNGVMRDLQRRLGEAVDAEDLPVRLVTISFDAERDTPDVLRGFAATVGADPARWRFATGDPARLKQAIGSGFQVYYAPAAAEAFQFDPAFILVDGWGIIRAEYRTARPELGRLLRDIRLVADEARNSTGVARYAYEAAHLFLCYPR